MLPIHKLFTTPNQRVTLALVLIFIIAVFLRLDFVGSVSHKVSHDTIHYDIMVRQLLEKGVYAYKSIDPNAQVTPGYPLFMAAVYKLVDYQRQDPFPYIRYLQAFMSIITMYIAYRIATRIGGSYAGLITATLMAVYPPFVWTTGAILTETLASLLILLYVYLQLIAFTRKTAVFSMLAGVSMGLAVLTRPEFLVLIGAAYVYYWFSQRETAQMLRLFLYAVLGMALVLAPWVVRNIVTLHEPIVASTQVNPFAAGTYPNKNYDDGLVDRHGKTQMEVAKERLRIGFTEHTWTYVKWYTVGKLRSIYEGMFFGSGHAPMYPVIPFRPYLHISIVLVGLLSCAVLLRNWRQPAILLVVFLMVISITRLAFVPEYRYNFTVMPLFIILDSLLGVALWKSLARRYKWKTRSLLKGAEQNA